MGYCQRKVYWKILHCRLWGISEPLLTHVSQFMLSVQIMQIIQFMQIMQIVQIKQIVQIMQIMQIMQIF